MEEVSRTKELLVPERGEEVHEKKTRKEMEVTTKPQRGKMVDEVVLTQLWSK